MAVLSAEFKVLSRGAAALCLLVLSFAVGAAVPANKFTPGATYYFDHFDSDQQPWEPGQDLNIEEVFKNYQYYEIVFSKTGKEITVNHHVQGNKADSAKYRIMPNWSLEKK